MTGFAFAGLAPGRRVARAGCPDSRRKPCAIDCLANPLCGSSRRELRRRVVLIAAYGTEVGKLVDGHMPSLLFELGLRGVPIDFRRCRNTTCADGAERGLVRRSASGLPIAAFAHVIDCRLDALDGSEEKGYDCSGTRDLYIQYWMYYADSATLRGVQIADERGYHRDDWESAQVRIAPDGSVDQRVSSHHGYNHERGIANWGSRGRGH